MTLCCSLRTVRLTFAALFLFIRPASSFNPRVRFQQITLIGVGLLGGSLGLAVKKRGLAGRVVGLVRRAESVEECRKLGVVDEATLDAETAIKNADLIVHCAPISQMRALTERFLPHLKPGAVVTDVGSVKGCVVDDLEQLIAEAGGRFVGAHPMAGGEQTGVAYSVEDLFEDSTVVLTPTPASDAAAVAALREFWTALGARLLETDPATHDELVARSSHLPHVAAAALVGVALGNADPDLTGAVCGPGFRDTTRVASGSPTMWRDIVLQNRGNVAAAIGDAIDRLEEVKKALDAGDAGALERFFAEAKELRDAWLDAGDVLQNPGSTENRVGG